MRSTARGLLSALSCLFITLNLVSTAASAISDFRYDDRDGDGVMDILTFSHEGHEFTVYDNDGDMGVEGSIESCCDMDSDTWIISKDEGSIIVDFQTDVKRENGSYVNATMASIYDDIDGDGKLMFTVETDGVVVEEGMPRIRIKTVNGRWSEEGLYGDIEMELFGDYGLQSDGGREYIDFSVKSRVVHDNLDGLIYLARDVKSPLEDPACTYAQYSDYTKPTRFSNIFMYGCIKEKAGRLWPVYGFPLEYNVDKSRVMGIDSFLEKVVDRHMIIDVKPGDRAYPFRNLYSWRGFVAGDDSAGGQGGNAGVGIRFFSLESPDIGNYSFSNRIEYAWDQDGDGSSDYDILYLSRFKERIPVEKPIPMRDNISVPVRPWDYLHGKEYTKEGGTTVLSVYDGEGANDFFYLNGQYLFKEIGTGVNRMLPLTVGGRIEATRSAPEFYVSEIDGRVHLRNVFSGSWLLGVDGSVTDASGKIKGSYFMYGDRSGMDYVSYSDRDNDGFIDTWERWIKGDSVEVLELRGSNVMLISDGLYFMRNPPEIGGETYPIPLDYEGIKSFERAFPPIRQDKGDSPAQIFNSINNQDRIKFDVKFLGVKYSNNTIVVEAMCEDSCEVKTGSGGSEYLKRGKYLIVYDGGHRVFKLTSTLEDYKNMVDGFFNRNPLVELVTLIVLSLLLFITLWERY
ncbi:MAG: hypothetical protein ABIH11_06875 [Candidatus Altiarchaeota archaeon]